MKTKTYPDIFLSDFDFSQGAEELSPMIMEGELLPKEGKDTSVYQSVYIFIDEIDREIEKKKRNYEENLKKRKWSKCYKEIYSRVSSEFNIEILISEITSLTNSTDENIIKKLAQEAERAKTIEKDEDFIYSSLNLLSKYHEIKRVKGEKNLSLNINTGVLSVDIIREGSDFDTLLNLAFCANGNVAFFSHDSDNDKGHSISGYMTHSGKYKSSKKIQSVLNILNRYNEE